MPECRYAISYSSDRTTKAWRLGAAVALVVLAYGSLAGPASADYLVTAFDETYYPINPENGYGGFTWGDFSYAGAVTDGASSLTLDVTNQDGMNNLAGGIGVGYPLHDFDSNQAEWEVRFKILSNNTAGGFRTSYVDDDGPGTSFPRRGTEFGYDFNISGLAQNQWHVLTKPFNNFAFNSTAFEHNVGDGVQNPGLDSIQLQSIFGSTGRLNVEFDYIRVKGLGDPPPPYPGAEPDAPWRAEAAARIDANRKADLRVIVTDALGNRLPDSDVGVHMQKHEFGFGSAVAGDRLASTSPAHNTYKQKVQELFNLATVENHLKWPPWEGEWGPTFSQANAIGAVNWLTHPDRDIDVRGHVLVWPGYDNLPNSVKTILNGGVSAAEQQPLRDLIDDHIEDIGSEFLGKLVAWDVVNEERTNHDIMDQLPEGDGAMVDWFEKARAVDPQAKLYINEWGILSSSGDTNSANQQQYYNTINYLKTQGAPIEGIGFQSHFNETTLTGPEQIWEILDDFQQLGLDMQVTEFDFDTDDETLQAMFTRDFLTAIFAHEGMDDFVMWGFWADAHWKPEAAMFRSDWSIKPNGEEYLDLVFNQWWTDEDVDADALGEALVRAFKGEHQIDVSWGEFSDTLEATLTGGGLELEIALPFLLGDYNRDGKVDTADYVVLRKTMGTAVATPGMGADGNHNGVIDIGDVAMWQAHFGAVMPGSGGSVAAVPEPASALLLLCGTALSGFGRRRGVVRGLGR
jgi:GH35 family endo-1,4-beta-xylanase